MSATMQAGGPLVVVGAGRAGLLAALRSVPEPLVVLAKALFGAEASASVRMAASPPWGRTTIRRCT